MPPAVGTAQCRQRRGSGRPCTPQSCPGPGSCRRPYRLPGDLLGQDLLLPDKPAGGTSSTSRGAARQLLPPTNRKPHAATLPRSHRRVHAASGRAAGPHPLPSSPWQRWGSRSGPPGTARELQPLQPKQPLQVGRAQPEPVCAGRAGQRGLMWCGTAWHDAELGCPADSRASRPAWRVPGLLVPPQPWPAVTGARGGAMSRPTNRSAPSQGVLPAARASLPELAWPKPLHPPRLPSQQPARDGLRWPAAAGFSHLPLAAQPAQTHVGGPHHATAPAPDDGTGPSSCRCRARAACGA